MNKLRELMPWNDTSSLLVRKGGSFGSSVIALQEEVNRLFDHFFTGAEVYTTNWGKKLSAPSVNVTEDGSSFKIEAELAGMDPKDIEVESVGRYITLRGERKEEKEEKKDGGNYLRQEISYGSFLRTVPLPETADSEKAKASFKNGILTVIVPKKAEARQKTQKIEIKAAA